jgi:hypothetical protein
MSATRCQVVLLVVLALGRDCPQPLWSSRITRYSFGSKKTVLELEQFPPGPPWRKITVLY